MGLLSLPGIPWGWARLTSPQHGYVFEGEWSHGQQNGVGRETIRNSDGVAIQAYEGGYRSSKKHGHGRMEQLSDSLRSCTILDGCWRHGQMIEGNRWIGETSSMSHLLRLLQPPPLSPSPSPSDTTTCK
jgi:hypothetical protein